MARTSDTRKRAPWTRRKRGKSNKLLDASQNSRTHKDTSAATVGSAEGNRKVPLTDNDVVSQHIEVKTKASKSEMSEVPSKIPLDLLTEVQNRLRSKLCHGWVFFVNETSINLHLVTIVNNSRVQRSLVFTFEGQIELYIHCKSLTVDPYLKNVEPNIPLEYDTINRFVDKILSITIKVKAKGICRGHENARSSEIVKPSCSFISSCPFGETLRSMHCYGLVNRSQKKCEQCKKLSCRKRRSPSP